MNSNSEQPGQRTRLKSVVPARSADDSHPRIGENSEADLSSATLDVMPWQFGLSAADHQFPRKFSPNSQGDNVPEASNGPVVLARGQTRNATVSQTANIRMLAIATVRHFGFHPIHHKQKA